MRRAVAEHRLVGKKAKRRPRYTAMRDQRDFARQWGVHDSTAMRRLRAMEARGEVSITRMGKSNIVTFPGEAPPGDSRLPSLEPAIQLERPFETFPVKDGTILIGADSHYWPGAISTAHRAFVAFCKTMAPKAVIFNGDVVDGASISRHPPIGWEEQPTLEDELIECQARLGEIISASPKGCRHFWPLGNHDARFNTRLASVAPEFRNVPGTRLVHHFPDWTPCWAVELGGPTGAVVKHRFKGGAHAPHNNALWSGRTMVTGHLHSQKVTPISDYNGTRYGVDTGCLATVGGRQFTYAEANPQNWRAGFAVLTWWKGTLLPPELITVLDEAKGLVVWRGSVLKV